MRSSGSSAWQRTSSSMGGPGGETRCCETVLQLSCEVKSGDWWVAPGPDLPAEARLAEGPLARRDGRVRCRALVTGRVFLGPGQKAMEVLPRTPEQDKMLEAVRQQDIDAEGARRDVRACEVEAREQVQYEAALGVQLSQEAYLVAKYQGGGQENQAGRARARALAEDQGGPGGAQV